MDANGEAENGDHQRESTPEETAEGADVKEEPQEVEMKGYAEDTMNELLGIYGYDGVDKSLTENLHLHHFAPEDQEKGNPGSSDKAEGGTKDKTPGEKTADKLSPGKQAEPKPVVEKRRRTSSASSYHQQDSPTIPATTNGSARPPLTNQYKASKSTHKRKAVSSVPAPPASTGDKKRQRHNSSSSSEDSSCSCGSCDLDHEGGLHDHGQQPVDVIREVQRLVDQNRTLKKENRRLKAELRESLNVKQLSQDIRHLTSQLQAGGGSASLSPLPRPPSNSSVSSSTPHKVTSSGKKVVHPKSIKQEDSLDHDGDEDELDLEHTEELWPDSGILLPSSRIQRALDNAQGNYRLFTRSLMEMVFTKETMAASSARGQKPQGKNAPENASPRPPLDQNAVQAIVSRVCSEFPEVHQTLVMSVVRQKIADVRKRLKIQSTRESAQQEVV